MKTTMQKKTISIFLFFLLASVLSSCAGNPGKENNLDGNNNDVPVTAGLNLQSLEYSTGNLEPEFNPDITNYNITVDNNISNMTITAIPEDEDAHLEITGTNIDSIEKSYIITLEVGDNLIDINIENNSSTKTYKLRIIRKSLARNYSFENSSDNIPHNWEDPSDNLRNLSLENALHENNAAYFLKLTKNSYREATSEAFKIDTGKKLSINGGFFTYSDANRTLIGYRVLYFTDELCMVPCETESSRKNGTNLPETGEWVNLLWEIPANEIPADANYAKLVIRIRYTDEGTSEDRVYFDNVLVSQE
ncbi:cadherin-like beta sandwich domain-containing protein [Spirochaetota bacterium]